jgi:hypothetical protein
MDRDLGQDLDLAMAVIDVAAEGERRFLGDGGIGHGGRWAPAIRNQ